MKPILSSIASNSCCCLLPDAQYCYSRAIMRRVLQAVLTASLAMGACLASLAAEGSSLPNPTERPREIYKALNALRVDSTKIYAVSEIRLRRDAVSLIFSDGVLGFLQAYDGRVTGVVFSGRGHVSANLRDPAEKQSLAHFLGVPLLDQSFSSAYLRFDDGSAEEILDQLRRSGANPMSADDFVSTWDKSVANLNPAQSTRLLVVWVAETPVPFFYAELVDERWGAFDILIDGRRTDTVLIGQDRWAAGTLALPQGAIRAGCRGSLARSLSERGAHPIPGSPGRKQHSAGVPTGATARGQTYRIRLVYRGSVISDAGNGVYFVGDRGIWYPHLGGMAQFAAFDTTFHWPRKLRLVATGQKVEEREEGDRRMGRWRSEGPAVIAGFNLGDYQIEDIEAVEGVKIEMAMNRALESALASQLRSPTTEGPMIAGPMRPNRRLRPPVAFSEDPPALVTGPLKELGQEIAGAVRFGKLWMGPFPFQQLVVSQVPGTFGQGFPGLLYLPSLSFLTDTAQQRVGMSGNAKEALNEVIPYHEVAHQWWGNIVGWDNYRDQWLTEGLANYVALAGADAEKPGSHLLTHWLDGYRKDLTSRVSGQESAVDDAGPLVHGLRLNSSRDPAAYEKIIYGKGSWVFHMLRMMMQNPASKNPDERFIGLLHGLLESHRYRALSTEDLQKAVERVMTPAMALEGGHSMDWFFEQFVRSTGVPAYELEYSVRPGPKGFVVRGKLIQKNVPDDFVLRVPIYGQAQGSKPALLGHVVTSGDETSFQFVSATLPKRLLIDPQMTLLCVSPSSSPAAPE